MRVALRPPGRQVARRALLVAQAVLVVGLGFGIVGHRFPLGVPGEWTWLRVPFAPEPLGLIVAALAVLAYAAFAALMMRRLGRRSGRWTEGVGVSGLVVAAAGLQLVVPAGAATGYDLTKWITLALPGTSGYHMVARNEVRDPWAFWAEYPGWIARQDALHIGTHPPGLILWAHAAHRLMESAPGLAAAIDTHLPGSVAEGFRAIALPLSRADRSALVLTALLTWLACAAAVAPLYALARASLPAPAAWAAASLWPLVPSAVLFQPVADTAYPLLATVALALAVWSARRGRGGIAAALGAGVALGVTCIPTPSATPALGAGVALGVGMQVTLAFLAVGQIVALVLFGAETAAPARESGRGWRHRGVLTLSVGAGFLAVTLLLWAVSGANPFVIWWVNQANHARFYAEFPRSYGAWVLANPIELAVGLGLPATLWALAGLAAGRRAPAVSWATVATMALLTLGGRNLSEVARLWLPLMPPLLVAAGAGLDRLGAGWRSLAVTLALLGAQTLLLQATIQVVYPV